MSPTGLSQTAWDLLRSSLLTPRQYFTQDWTLLHQLRRYFRSLHPLAILSYSVSLNIKLPSTTARRASDIERRKWRQPEKEWQPRSKRTPTSSWSTFCQEAQLPLQSTAVFIFRPKIESSAIGKECLASGEELVTEWSWIKALVKQVLDSNCRRPIHTQTFKTTKVCRLKLALRCM